MLTFIYIGIALIFFLLGVWVGVNILSSLDDISIADYSYADPYVDEYEEESEI